MDVLSFFLHKIVVYRQFSYLKKSFQNGRQRSRDYFIMINSSESFIYRQHSVKFYSNRYNGSGDTLC